MTKLSYAAIKKEVDRLAQIIKAPEHLLPSYGQTRDSAYPHIEIDSMGLLHYVVVERGQELDRRTTNNLHDLLYWIFSSISFSMACKFELNNRIKVQDSRRLMFQKQEELLAQLDQQWEKREIAEHKQILHRSPFDDNINLRVDFYVELITKGYSIEDATKLSVERYPEPNNSRK